MGQGRVGMAKIFSGIKIYLEFFGESSDIMMLWLNEEFYNICERFKV